MTRSVIGKWPAVVQCEQWGEGTGVITGAVAAAA